MKDKTHSMNMDHSGEGTVNGYEKIPNGEVPTRPAYKNRQLKVAGLLENEALIFQEDMNDENTASKDGFLKRNNYHDRY